MLAGGAGTTVGAPRGVAGRELPERPAAALRAWRRLRAMRRSLIAARRALERATAPLDATHAPASAGRSGCRGSRQRSVPRTGCGSPSAARSRADRWCWSRTTSATSTRWSSRASCRACRSRSASSRRWPLFGAGRQGARRRCSSGAATPPAVRACSGPRRRGARVGDLGPELPRGHDHARRRACCRSGAASSASRASPTCRSCRRRCPSTTRISPGPATTALLPHLAARPSRGSEFTIRVRFGCAMTARRYGSAADLAHEAQTVVGHLLGDA